MEFPRLTLLRTDPHRHSVRLPRFPDKPKRQRDLQEGGKTPREQGLNVAARTHRPAHHRLGHERAPEHRRERRHSRRIPPQRDPTSPSFVIGHRDARSQDTPVAPTGIPSTSRVFARTIWSPRHRHGPASRRRRAGISMPQLKDRFRIRTVLPGDRGRGGPASGPRSVTVPEFRVKEVDREGRGEALLRARGRLLCVLGGLL